MPNLIQKSFSEPSTATSDLDPAVALHIKEAEARLSRLIRTQFLFMSFAAIASVVLVVGAFALITTFTRVPSNTTLLDQIEESNKQLSTITQSILQPTPGITTTRALELVLAQAEIHQRAVEELRRTQQQTAPETQSLIQIIGSAAVLALLGALGLQRLQNIDTEINNLRESMYAQIEARAKDIREILGATIDDQVDKAMSKTRKDIEDLTKQAAQQVTDILNDAQQRFDALKNEVGQVQNEVGQVRTMLDQYPWLKSKEKFDKASRIKQLSSVEQAHRLAVEFSVIEDDDISARAALQEIVLRKLPGDADDFHNAHAQAMRMEEVKLALEIVDLGLQNYPDQYDLMADKAISLRSLGRAAEARQLLDDWRQRKPEEFIRSWRPAVFYVDTFRALDLTPDAIETIESMLRHVTEKRPYEIKPWSAYAQFVSDQGRPKEAEQILLRALELNPLSQQLNYVLGELLLKQGRAEEARSYLEKALRIDYQPQYQPDVNQYAVRATLAQAYEACDELDKARLLYQSIIVATDRDASRTIKDYAKGRLAAIALIEGNLPKEEILEASQEEILTMLRTAIHGAGS
ncbi:MAG: tetratricopeptide repeat protein [Candidatus Methanomethylicaceae archaeon]